MSKQSNQRYRKEIDKKQDTKTDLGSSEATPGKNRKSQDKINREFDAPTNGVYK